MHYRKEIDGLRAIAVLPVILFHAGFDVFSGGFVGVDVFFVLSGYLITTILIEDLDRGNFSIAKFYERRARRILPALFAVMFTCLPFAYMWMLPEQLVSFSKSLIAAVLSFSNFFFLNQTDYFAPLSETQPLLHTWSLAVEEQYYLIFPIILLVLWRFGRKFVFSAIIAFAVISFILAEFYYNEKLEESFYLPHTRAWELLAGSICAFLLNRKLKFNTIKSNLFSIFGFLLIIASIFLYDEYTPFPSIYAMVPVVGAALVILFATKDTFVAKLLGLRGFVGIGLISYSAYLWHQPLFAFARLRSLTEPSPVLMFCLAALSLFLATATWYWVEQPFRGRSNSLTLTRRSVFAASAGLGAILVAIGIAGIIKNGFESRAPHGVNIAQLFERMLPNYGMHIDCGNQFNQSENCFTASSPKVLLWGDSYAMHLAPGILASDGKILLQQYTFSCCAPILGIAQSHGRYSKEWSMSCIKFNNQVLEWLNEKKSVELVVLSSPYASIFRGRLFTESGDVFSGDKVELVLKSILETVSKIRDTGARVVIVSPTPVSGHDIGRCLMISIFLGLDEESCDFSLNTESDSLLLLRRVEKEVPIYWLYNDICPNGICDVLREGLMIYRDSGHLSIEGSAYLGQRYLWSSQFSRVAE